jgi:hypothetical protein
MQVTHYCYSQRQKFAEFSNVVIGKEGRTDVTLGSGSLKVNKSLGAGLLQQMLGTSNSLPTQALACYVNDVNA